MICNRIFSCTLFICFANRSISIFVQCCISYYHYHRYRFAIVAITCYRCCRFLSSLSLFIVAITCCHRYRRYRIAFIVVGLTSIYVHNFLDTSNCCELIFFINFLSPFPSKIKFPKSELKLNLERSLRLKALNQ